MFKEALKDVRKIVTHENCADGTVSGMILRDALPNTEVVFLQHGTEPYLNLPVEDGLLFCDIVPPPARADEFVQAGALVLDHHKTARSVVAKFGPNGVFSDEAKEPGVSGAMLAYREVWEPLRGDSAHAEFVRNLATLTGIRDTWQNQDARWKEACEQASLIHFQANTEWLRYSLKELAGTWGSSFEWIGRILVDKHQRGVKKSVQRAGRFTSPKGTRVVVFNSTAHTSDAVELLGSEADLVVGFSYEVENDVEKLILSTRSHTTFDCSAFAKSYGGGGHLRAAGFSVPVGSQSPYQTVLGLVQAFEAANP